MRGSKQGRLFNGCRYTNYTWTFKCRPVNWVQFTKKQGGSIRTISHDFASSQRHSKRGQLGLAEFFDGYCLIRGASWRMQLHGPASLFLALHANSVAIPWATWRLEAIETWLSQQLHRAATRDGSSLQSLPPAKQDRRCPHLSLAAGPLRP